MSETTSLTPTQLAAQQSTIGRRLRAAGENTKAEVRFRTALSFTPDDASLHGELALCLERQKKFHDALYEAAVALQLAPQNAYYHYLKGAIFNVQNLYSDAQLALQRAIELDPRHASSHQLLGYVLWRRALIRFGSQWNFCSKARLKALQEAESSTRYALQLQPNLAEAHRILGHILLSQRRHDEAIAQMENALKIEPKNALAHLSLGTTSLRFPDADVERATEHLRESLRLNPHDKRATVQLRSAQRQLAWARYFKPLMRVRSWIWNHLFGPLPRGLRVVVFFSGMISLIVLQERVQQSPLPRVREFNWVANALLWLYVFAFPSFANWLDHPSTRKRAAKTVIEKKRLNR